MLGSSNSSDLLHFEVSNQHIVHSIDKKVVSLTSYDLAYHETGDFKLKCEWTQTEILLILFNVSK